MTTKQTKTQPETRPSEVRSDALLERLARWIVQHPPEYGGDHACAQCYPHSGMLKDGFVCAFHEAERIVNSSNATHDGRRIRRTVDGIVGNSWRDKAAEGLLETRTVGEHSVRVYADRLAIWRKDGQRLSWEELQAVKCAVWGDRVAIEVYPAQCDVVNLRHTRHLWTGLRLTEAVVAECTHAEFANAQVSERSTAAEADCYTKHKETNDDRI